MLLRISREEHLFDLGLEIGNIDAYCTLVFDLVLEAIAFERRSRNYEYPGNYAWNYLHDNDRVMARFAFLVGLKFDHERIMEDITEVYKWLCDPMDELYPDWAISCPGKFRFTLTPSSFEFAVGK